jgi:hypothetical protein
MPASGYNGSYGCGADERRLRNIQTGNMDIEKIIDGVVSRFIGTKHERDIKKIAP